MIMVFGSFQPRTPVIAPFAARIKAFFSRKPQILLDFRTRWSDGWCRGSHRAKEKAK